MIHMAKYEAEFQMIVATKTTLIFPRFPSASSPHSCSCTLHTFQSDDPIKIGFRLVEFPRKIYIYGNVLLITGLTCIKSVPSVFGRERKTEKFGKFNDIFKRIGIIVINA